MHLTHFCEKDEASLKDAFGTTNNQNNPFPYLSGTLILPVSSVIDVKLILNLMLIVQQNTSMCNFYLQNTRYQYNLSFTENMLLNADNVNNPKVNMS